MSQIEIENLSFSYDDSYGKKSKNAEPASLTLENINLNIPDGQFLCIIGHSGSGKSTLLRLLVGLNPPTSGRILIDGKTVDGTALNKSVVFQNYSLFPWMTARKNVEFGIEQANNALSRGLTKKEIASIAENYLERVNMKDALDKYPYQLSGGMQQRVAIARALAMDTQIVLFDEPFGALDVKTRRDLQKLVVELWNSGDERKTMVFVTHDISEAILLSDRIVFMSHGQLIADYTDSIPRPRTFEDVVADEQAIMLRKELTRLFYLDEVSDDECFDLLVQNGEV